jgi:hypothetical protein
MLNRVIIGWIFCILIGERWTSCRDGYAFKNRNGRIAIFRYVAHVRHRARSKWEATKTTSHFSKQQSYGKQMRDELVFVDCQLT